MVRLGKCIPLKVRWILSFRFDYWDLRIVMVDWRILRRS